MKRFVYENKNHWANDRLVCTHFDAFYILIPNMDTKCKISEISKKIMKNISVNSTRQLAIYMKRIAKILKHF